MALPLIPIVLAGVAGALLTSGRRGSVGASMQLGYSMDGGSEATRAELERYANAQAQNNADWFKRHPEAPCCVGCGGFSYTGPTQCRGNRSCQSVKNAAAMVGAKRGTCIDLACYDAGHKIAEGEAAEVVLVHEQDAAGNAIEYRYHAVVRTAAGIEDPSAELQAKTAGCGCEAA